MANDAGDLGAPLLSFEAVQVVYAQVVLALRGVTLTVPRGTIVALLGPNGAGKSTTLKTASGLLEAERGAITGGAVTYGELDLGRPGPRALVGHGVVQVLEGRRCFPHLTVAENLRTGTLARRVSRSELGRELERIYAYFPRLAEKRHVHAGFTSGGEQQMIAIGRALLARPRLLLLDEPSMGLAPKVVEEIFAIVHRLHDRENLTVLLAEQNATLALRYAHHGYVLESGRVVAHGSAEELRSRTDVQELYLGLGTHGDRKRFTRARLRSAPPSL